MESVEASSYIREAALGLAVQHAHGRPGYAAEDVIEDANIFLSWLTNLEGNLDG